MIAIVISEKGGAERREQYAQNEITIGRVKGNDVLLPKGNVSKRHARLIVRDGRYIVTDLKSTNGTYVNHRRITHATLVREGDRIYIGDFVLRIEGDAIRSSSSAPASFSPESNRPSASTGRNAALSALPMERTQGPHEDVVSHFPIEHDPDESSPLLDVPAAPRVPSGMRSATSPSTTNSSFDMPHTSEHSSRPSNPGVLGVGSEHTPQHGLRSSRPVSGEVDRQAARMTFLEQLVLDVEKQAGLEPLASLEPDDALRATVDQALDAGVAKLVEEGLPDGLDPAMLREAAREELLGLGPLEPLLDDDNITQVQVLARRVSVHRRGRRVHHAGFDFATEAGVARALARFCKRMGIALDGDPYLEAPLEDGRRLLAVLPDASRGGHLLLVERPHRARASLDGLVRSGAISRGMATLLTHCMAARANILVVGGSDSGAPEIVDALVGATSREAPALWLFDDGSRDLVPSDAASLELGPSVESRVRAIATAARLGPEHLVAPPLAGESLAALLDAITHGAEGVVLRASAGTFRQALDRMSADLASARPGVSPMTAREWVGSAFDVGLEVTRLRDGRPRVVRLVELRGGSQGMQLREVFTFAYHRTAAGGSIEGSFYASGTVPRIVEDLAARGMPLDTTIFRRHPST